MSERKHRASVDLFQYVRALARSNLDATVCMTEFIDNSLDSGARSVRIEVLQGKMLRISDDGDGVRDMDALVRFGGHVPHPTLRGSGIFGVGFKEASLKQGGERGVVRVRTVRSGQQTNALISWALLESSDECMTTSGPVAVADEPDGTEIEIRPLKPRFPDGERRKELLDQLAYIYSLALRGGARISLQAGGAKHELSAEHRWRLPKDLTDVVDTRVSVGSKRARVYAGIVPVGQPNPKAGLTYMHRYRVIGSRPRRDGCGTHSVARIAGFVEILDGWERTKNKDNLVDAEDLYDEVERVLEPILAKAETQAHELHNEAMLSALECALAGVVGLPSEKAKRAERRDHSRSPGEPTGEGQPHRDAKKRQPGSTMKSKAAPCLKLEWIDGWKKGVGLGVYEETHKVHAIKLYRDHPSIARSLSTSTWDWDGIVRAALTVKALTPPFQGNLYFDIHKAHADLARWLASPNIRIDGVELGKAPE